MKILVLGAGIAGITAAYALASRGHEVEVVEREGGAALQTSFANGGQLSYSHAQPWANPGALPKVLRWMFKDDAPLVLRPRADLEMLRWGWMFLRNCTSARAEAHSRTMLRLGLYARGQMAQMRAETGIAFDFLAEGILHLFSHERDFAAARRQAAFQAALGCREEILDASQCLAREPALAHTRKSIIGGIFSPLDESGDAHLFTGRLAAFCEARLGVRFHYGCSVLRLECGGGEILGVVTPQGTMRAERYVMALGAWGTKLLRPAGVRLPVYPMKGYSVTVPAWDGAPSVSLTDDENKVVVSRLGNRIRAAGTAEFAGYSTTVKERRIAPILRCLKDLFPAAPLAAPERWACIRPQTPDGPPVIGATRCRNLFLHTGHGTLGWTQSAGTAQLLADLMEGRPTGLPLDGLTAERYSRFAR